MEPYIRYHEIKSTAKDMIKSAWDLGCAAVDRLLIGERPKNIVDYSGKPQHEADAVKSVIDSLPQVERTDVSQIGKTALNRWDDMGNYYE